MMHPTIARRPVAQRLREWLIARCLAPINIDGSQVSDVTIDGKSVSEVTMDGQQVFGSAIPDSENIQLRYIAEDQTNQYNDGETVSTLSADVGSDLSATGNPSLNVNAKNDLAAIGYDGSDDGHEGSLSTTFSQPTHRFVVFQYRSFSGSNDYLLGTQTDTARHDFIADSGADEYGANAATTLPGGSPDTNWHIATILYDGTNSHMRIDGTQVASGDAGTNDYGDLSIGYLGWSNGNHSDALVTELADYGVDESLNERGIEQFLADKYGITL
jgi:hypothetical protein